MRAGDSTNPATTGKATLHSPGSPRRRADAERAQRQVLAEARARAILLGPFTARPMAAADRVSSTTAEGRRVRWSDSGVDDAPRLPTHRPNRGRSPIRRDGEIAPRLVGPAVRGRVIGGLRRAELTRDTHYEDAAGLLRYTLAGRRPDRNRHGNPARPARSNWPGPIRQVVDGAPRRVASQIAGETR